MDSRLNKALMAMPYELNALEKFRLLEFLNVAQLYIDQGQTNVLVEPSKWESFENSSVLDSFDMQPNYTSNNSGSDIQITTANETNSVKVQSVKQCKSSTPKKVVSTKKKPNDPKPASSNPNVNHKSTPNDFPGLSQNEVDMLYTDLKNENYKGFRLQAVSETQGGPANWTLIVYVRPNNKNIATNLLVKEKKDIVSRYIQRLTRETMAIESRSNKR